jgi:hypothetical protein
MVALLRPDVSWVDLPSQRNRGPEQRSRRLPMVEAGSNTATGLTVVSASTLHQIEWHPLRPFISRPLRARGSIWWSAASWISRIKPSAAACSGRSRPHRRSRCTGRPQQRPQALRLDSERGADPGKGRRPA